MSLVWQSVFRVLYARHDLRKSRPISLFGTCPKRETVLPPCRKCLSRSCFATARQRRGCGDSVPPSSAPGSGGPQSHDCIRTCTTSDDRDDQPGHGTQVQRVGALFFWPGRPKGLASRRGPSSFRQGEKKMGGALRRICPVSRTPRAEELHPAVPRQAAMGSQPLRCSRA